MTSSAMAASASAEACTNAPGGGTRRTPETSIAGSASVRIGSPPIDSRAMPAALAASASRTATRGLGRRRVIDRDIEPA